MNKRNVKGHLAMDWDTKCRRAGQPIDMGDAFYTYCGEVYCPVCMVNLLMGEDVEMDGELA